MSDVASDEGSDTNQDETQEEVMTPAELISKLEEVRSFSPFPLLKALQNTFRTRFQPRRCVVLLCGRLG